MPGVMEQRVSGARARGVGKERKGGGDFKAPMHLFYLTDSAGYRVDGSLGHEGDDLFCPGSENQLATTLQGREGKKNPSQQVV